MFPVSQATASPKSGLIPCGRKALRYATCADLVGAFVGASPSDADGEHLDRSALPGRKARMVYGLSYGASFTAMFMGPLFGGFLTSNLGFGLA